MLKHSTSLVKITGSVTDDGLAAKTDLTIKCLVEMAYIVLNS